jgi:hypothetical protein
MAQSTMTVEAQAADVTSAHRAKVSAEALRGQIQSQHFAVLATTGADGSPDSAGVSYRAVVERGELVLYVMTRRHLRKARDIAHQSRVSLVIPIRRRMLWFIPPATMQLRGDAELLPQDDQRGTLAFQGFFLGRRILAAYRAMRLRGDDRICFVRITLDATARSYMVGASLWQVIRRMEAGAATTDLRGK